MNNKFDELTKGMAQSVTRRGALKKFGVGLAGLALALLGLETNAHAERNGKRCLVDADCPKRKYCEFDSSRYIGICTQIPFSP